MTTMQLAVENVAIHRRSLTDGAPVTRVILSGVAFTVPAGGRLAIVGPSGAGKTSLLRLLNRLDDPAEGRIHLDGVDLREMDPQALRRRVGMLFQHPFLFDGTLYDNLAYPLRLLRQSLAREQAAALLAEMGLDADLLDRKSDQLSIGQTQRVALARALTLSPEVLLLDEPTSALDEESAEMIVATLLRRNREAGLTVIMITHARTLLARLDCPVLLLHDGRAHLLPDAPSALDALHREKTEMA